MLTYQLKRSVPAARYEPQVNEAELFELMNLGGASFNNLRGTLHVYNQGHDVEVHPGQWVVRLGGDFIVLEDSAFADLFESI